MRFSLILLGLLMSTACVTEVKDAKNNKPYVADLSQKVVSQTANGTSGEPKLTSIIVKCRIQNDKSAKLVACNSSTVKLVDEVTKASSDFKFQGEKAVIPAALNTSYKVEISTKGCPEPRVFVGMIGGVGITAQFENCSGK